MLLLSVLLMGGRESGIQPDVEFSRNHSQLNFSNVKNVETFL